VTIDLRKIVVPPPEPQSSWEDRWYALRRELDLELESRWRLETNYRAALENLSATQARCTELLDESRAFRRMLVSAGLLDQDGKPTTLFKT
jgi:hypothetical protein